MAHDGNRILASQLFANGEGLDAATLAAAATLELDWSVRQKSRFDAVDSLGRHLGVFLPRGTVVRGGDVLVAEQAPAIRIVAANEPVLRVTSSGDDAAFALMRGAYHLGNRHVPIELRPRHLKIEPDHVLADMLRTMGLEVQAVSAPFEPEAGAYGGGHRGHSHHHDRDAQHSHRHEHDDNREHAHGHRHEHPTRPG